jgi:transcriptional regulator with XRE-family HTH domain
MNLAIDHIPGETEIVVTNRLARELFEREWTDTDLAARTGLSRSRINRLKNRRVRPTTRDALLIAAALGKPVASLFEVEIRMLRERQKTFVNS